MKKRVLIALFMAMTVPVVVAGQAMAEMEPIEMRNVEGPVTVLASADTVPPGATVTSELTDPVSSSEPTASNDSTAPEEVATEEYYPVEAEPYSWVPDVVTEYAEAYGTIVVVDITNQHVYCCVDGAVIADADCVSGDLYNSPTPTGLYNVWYKQTDFYMMGTYYTAYAAFFNGDIALHDADAWRSEYGGYIYQGGGSHGCVNLPRWFAEIVYNNTWEGTPVYVF